MTTPPPDSHEKLLDRPDGHMLTTSEVARVLSCSPQAVRKLVKRKVIPASRIGQIRIRVGDLKALIERRKIWTRKGHRT